MGALVGSIFQDLKCAQYNGTDEASYRLNPSWKTDSAGAFSIWFRIPAVLGATGYIPILSLGDTRGANNSFLALGCRRHPTGGTGTYFSMTIRNLNWGTVYGLLATTTPLAANVWYHGIGQCNGSAWSLYLNGVSQTLTVWSTSNTGIWLSGISGTNHQLAFGANYRAGAYSGYGDIRLDEGLYFNRVLTGSEVTWLYNSGTPRNPHRYDWAGALKSWWRFGDSRDTGTTIYDEIGANDMTNQNMDASNYVTP